jgi:hypothetical protein
MNLAVRQNKNIVMLLGATAAGSEAMLDAVNVFGFNPIAADDGLYEINNKLFSSLKFVPDSLQAVPVALQTPEYLGDIYQKTIDLLTKQFMQFPDVVVADARVIKVLPFWRSILTKMNVSHNYVIALRDPFAQARAYQEQTGCELEFGLLFWSTQLLQAIEGTHGARRMVVSYDLLLRDPRKQLERLRNIWQIGEVDESLALNFSKQYFDGKLPRFHPDFHELCTNPAARAANLSKSLYECLLKLAQDEMHFEDAEFKARWQAIMNEYTTLAPMYAYLDRLLKKRSRLKRVVSEIRESWMWKFMAPLRFIDNKLRERRRKKHLQNRAIVSHE